MDNRTDVTSITIKLVRDAEYVEYRIEESYRSITILRTVAVRTEAN